MVRHAVCGGENKKLIQGFDRETEGKSPTGKTRYIWEDNINTFASSYLNTQGLLNASHLKGP
jgi:hypothetical protein